MVFLSLYNWLGYQMFVVLWVGYINRPDPEALY